MNDTSEDTYDDLGKLRGEGSAIDARWFTETNLGGGSYQFPVAGSYFFNVVDFTEVNLSQVNFSNLDMAGIILDGADLQDANLSGVNLYKLSLEYLPTVGGSYTKVYHYPSFVGANLQGADLSGTYLEANMTGANLSGLI